MQRPSSVRFNLTSTRDLTSLPDLTLDSVLQLIRDRYEEDIIYTCCGDVLLSVNPFKPLQIYDTQHHEEYQLESLHKDQEPHVFQVAAQALKRLRDSERNQVVLVSGESGAGKTENTKFMLTHLVEMCGGTEGDLHDKILQLNPLLEAFGNAKTVLNNNSSRFAKFLQLDFSKDLCIQKASIKDYMLEKSRVVHQSRGEGNFHIFYAFLAGLSAEDRESLSVSEKNTFRIANLQERCLTSEDGRMFEDYMKIFHMIQLSEEEIENVKAILAAILHLTNLQFMEDDNQEGVKVLDEVPLLLVSELLQVSAETLATTLVTKKIDVMGEEIETLRSKKNADGARDALAKALYERLFGWVVRKINESLQPSYDTSSSCGSLGILDICGFESLQTNSFEQMLINLVNEKIQGYMNELIFEREKQIYTEQGLELSLQDIQYTGNNDIVDMFTGRLGILALINEDTRLEQSTDQSMVMKLGHNFATKHNFRSLPNDGASFIVVHFAGEVRYDGRSFLEKNRDSLSPEMLTCMKTSSNVMVDDLFTVAKGVTGTISVTNYNYRASRKRDPVRRPHQININLTSSIVASRRQTLKQRYGGVRRGREHQSKQSETVIDYFKNSLSDLVKSMESADAVFVRCIKPNTRLQPDKFDDRFVSSQLRYNGITEVARIRKRLWPIRRQYAEILTRFQSLSDANFSDRSMDSVRDVAGVILSSAGVHSSSYALGRDLIFMKQVALEKLETALRNKLEEERRKEVEKQRQEDMRKREAEKRKQDEEKRKQDAVKRKQDAENKNYRSNHLPWIPLTTIPEPPNGSVSSGTSGTSGDSAMSFTSGSSDMDGRDARERKNKPCKGKNTDSPKRQRPEPAINGAAPDVPPRPKGPKAEKNFWDIFRVVDTELPRQEAYNEMTLKIVKVVVYILLLVLLLVSCVGQRVGLLVMVASIPAKSTEPRSVTPGRAEPGALTQYFFLGIVMIIPYMLTSLTSLFKWLFGSFPSPGALTWITTLLLEILHSFGLSVLVFWVLPKYDIIFGAYLLSATCVLPSLMMLTTTSSNLADDSAAKTVLKKVIDFLALLCQVSVIPALIWRDQFHQHLPQKRVPGDLDIAAIAVSFVLSSLKCWENFVDGKCEKLDSRGETTRANFNNAFMDKVLKIRFELQEGRYVVTMVSGVLKVVVTLGVLYGAMYLQTEPKDVPQSMRRLLTMFQAIGSLWKYPDKAAPLLLVSISSFFAWYLGYIACKLNMQIFSFSIPLLLTVPVTQGLLAFNCYMPDGNVSSSTFLDDYTLYNVCYDYAYKGCEHPYCFHYYFGAAWLLSLLWICRHIWRPTQGRLEEYDRLFINPFYCGVLTMESILLSRRRHKEPVRMEGGRYFIVNPKSRFEQMPCTPEPDAADSQTSDGEIPFVYACATMWHETKVEMTQLMKSLFRLDYDRQIREQCAFLLGKEKTKDRFNYQAHIFFDDALELNEDDKYQANQFVKQLMEVMSDACSSVHQVYMSFHDPFKVITPYGAQLIWEMPGGSLLYVHVKDKNKIRHRKRWSQVMYMYYLLGYQLLKDSQNEVLANFNEMNVMSKDDVQKLFNINVQNKTQNTFILALDGDTDFSPGSVRVLLDKMSNEKVAAVCGRIHPIGSGPLVWYQMFEYAVGHWLQKATEHVLGCVLCSPGCFSLFRASAIMDNNVMRRYTTFPTQPGHFLQYDQGEDRWLCTLLLQQGYRVDYAAAADAYTYAPEGFNEFFNQRRRWTPSTLANILDLLTSADVTVHRNPNISYLYIVYQVAMMFGTVLGPGTVIMMIAGAIGVVFNLEVIWSYVISLAIPIVYTIICFTTPSNIQLYFGAVFSAIYSFIMMAVIAGTLVTAINISPFHPSVIFTVLLFGMFFIAAVLHWKEFNCLPHAFLYFLCIPSGYLLLFIYSMANLYNVSWGTREIAKRKTKKELAEEKKAQEEKKKEEKKKDGLFARLFFSSTYVKEIKTMIESFKPKLMNTDQGDNAKIIALLEKMNANIELLTGKSGGDRTSEGPKDMHDEKNENVEPEESTESEESEEEEEEEVEDLDPYRGEHWVNDPRLGHGQVNNLCTQENGFWEMFIKKYLKPIDKDEQREKGIKDGLIELRNNICFALIMVNSLWMATNFMFQIKDVASVKIYFTENGEDKEIKIGILGLLFIAFFTILIVIQFFGMLIHRWETLLHLISMTELTSMSTTQQKDIADGKQVMRQLMGVIEPSVDYDDDDEEDEIENRIKEVVLNGTSARELAQSRAGGLLRASRHAATEMPNLRQTFLEQRVETPRYRPDYDHRDRNRGHRYEEGGLRNRYYTPAVDYIYDDVRARTGMEDRRPPRAERDADYAAIRDFMPGRMGRDFARKIRSMKDNQRERRNQDRANGRFEIPMGNDISTTHF